MLCSFALFVSLIGFTGPEKPRWRNSQFKIFIHLFIFLFNVVLFDMLTVSRVQNLSAAGHYVMFIQRAGVLYQVLKHEAQPSVLGLDITLLNYLKIFTVYLSILTLILSLRVILT